MNFRRLAVCLGIGLAVSFAPVAVYVLTTRQHHRKKVFSDTFSPRRSLLRGANEVQLVTIVHVLYQLQKTYIFL